MVRIEIPVIVNVLYHFGCEISGARFITSIDILTRVLMLKMLIS
jgi:hypothetical protein